MLSSVCFFVRAWRFWPSIVVVFTAAAESCDILSALLIETMVDLYVDLPLELTVACVTGLLEALSAAFFVAVVFFVVAVVFFVVTVVLSKLEDSDNGAVEGVVREYDVVLPTFVLFVRCLRRLFIALFLLGVNGEAVNSFSFVDSVLSSSVVLLGGLFDFKLTFSFNLSRVKQY